MPQQRQALGISRTRLGVLAALRRSQGQRREHDALTQVVTLRLQVGQTGFELRADRIGVGLEHRRAAQEDLKTGQVVPQIGFERPMPSSGSSALPSPSATASTASRVNPPTRGRLRLRRST
jgi:hypothetical protein